MSQLLPAEQGLTWSIQCFSREISITPTNLSSASLSPALITKHGCHMIQNIILVSFRPLYQLHFLPGFCCPQHCHAWRKPCTVQALVSGSQALLTYQHCFSVINTVLVWCKAEHQTVSYTENNFHPSETKHVFKKRN